LKGAVRALEVANRHPGLRLNRRAIAAAIGLLDSNAGAFRGGCPPGELSLAFLTDAALAELHGAYLSDASPTDVITFGGEAASGTAGEICVSADAAARRSGASRAGLSEEVTLYVVHGWLHLAGYDDADPLSRRRMRRAEARAMRLIAQSGALPRFKLA
jgi:probable rRNA maturation factor